MVCPPHAPPFPDDPTTATRHLCAGAYLDQTFRDTALREVYHRRDRAVAPSYGFSLTPVLAHCLRARCAALIRDATLTVTLVAALTLSPISFLYAVTLAAVLHAVVATGRLADAPGRRPRSATGLRAGLGWVLAASLILLLRWAVTADPDALGAGGLLVLLVLLTTSAAWSLWAQAQLDRFRPGRTPCTGRAGPRLHEIDLQQYGNTVVHAGHDPFIGTGAIVDTWEFTQPLGPGPVPFHAAEAVAHLQRQLGALVGGPGTVPEETITGLTVTDRIHLAGTEVSRLDPVTPPEVVADIIQRPTGPARHHLACQVPSSGGEVVTTVHIHLAVQAGVLYLEVTTTALTPCPRAYRIVDLPDAAGLRAALGALRAGLASAPGRVALAPFRLLRALGDALPDNRAFTRHGPNRPPTAPPPRTVPNPRNAPHPPSNAPAPPPPGTVPNPPPRNAPSSGNVPNRSGVPHGSDMPDAGNGPDLGDDARTLRAGLDHGARVSVRELACPADDPARYPDIVKHQRLIECRLFEAVADFLDAKGIDSTDCRSRPAVPA